MPLRIALTAGHASHHAAVAELIEGLCDLPYAPFTEDDIIDVTINHGK